MLLSKLPSRDVQDALSTVKTHYTVVLLTKELTSQTERCNNSLTVIEVTGIP